VPDAATPAKNKSESPGRPKTIGRPVSTKRMVKIPIRPKELIAFSAEKIPLSAGYRAGVVFMV